MAEALKIVDLLNNEKFTVHNGKKGKTINTGESTLTECLYDEEEIISVYNVLVDKVNNATTLSKKANAQRNLTMFVCAIQIGLRGGDFCRLKWSDIYDINWRFKHNPDFIPEKTKNKHVRLIWNSDFEVAMENWRMFKIKCCEYVPEYDDYIFPSQSSHKKHISRKSWSRLVKEICEEAAINHRVGTHGLRKTMVHQFIKHSESESEGVMQMCNYLNHSDLRVTMRYACIENEKIRDTKSKMNMFY